MMRCSGHCILALLVSLLEMSSGLRILALHGSGSHGARFSQQTKCFQEALEEIAPQAKYTFLDGPFSKDTGFSWWKMKEGERSSNAKELIGLDKSLRLIEEPNESYDIIIGHSQGAMMAAIVLARGVMKTPKLAILTGSSYPESQHELFSKASGLIGGLRSIHCIGRADEINPPDLARKLALSFNIEGNAEVIDHGGGHIFPQDEASLGIMMHTISTLH